MGEQTKIDFADANKMVEVDFGGRAKHMARRTDPVSSILAAIESIRTGAHAKQCAVVLDMVVRFPGCTARELAVARGIDRYMVSRRLPDLERNGLVVRGEIRSCREGGKKSLTWWPSNPLPEGLR